MLEEEELLAEAPLGFPATPCCNEEDGNDGPCEAGPAAPSLPLSEVPDVCGMCIPDRDR